MSFSSASPEELIFKKTKEWWNNLKKIHLPEERKRFTDKELIRLSHYQQKLQLEVRNLELELEKKPNAMIDFRKLKNLFHKEYKYSYGVPIIIISSDSKK